MKLIFLTLFIHSTFLFASQDGSLFLGIDIPSHFQIRVEPSLLGEDPLDLLGGEISRKIAEINEVSNHPLGYEMYIESVNGGRLLDGLGNGPAYQLQYGTAGTFFSAPAAGSPALIRTSGALSGLTFSLIDLFFQVNPNANLAAGYYTDTLIFTMQGL